MSGGQRLGATLAALLLGAMAAAVVFVPRSRAQWVGYGPGLRSDQSAVYDSSTNAMIMFGGQNLGAAAYNDVWLAVNVITNRCNPCDQQWNFLSTSGTPPAARFGHTAVYDSAHARMVVFGGALGSPTPCSNDVWVLSNANGAASPSTWTQLNPTGTQPIPRMGQAAGYDPVTNRLILFGGTDCNGRYLSDVWVLANANGTVGTPAWKQLTPSGSIPARANMAYGYNTADNTLVVYGGTNGTSFSDVWVLSNANGKGSSVWTQLSPSGTGPAARFGAASAIDVGDDRLIFHGGTTSAGIVADAWVLGNADGIGGTPSWQMLMPMAALPSLTCHSGVYDPTSNKFVVVGGISNHSPTPTTGNNDVFVLIDANGL